jgi:hypothetical protein
VFPSSVHVQPMSSDGTSPRRNVGLLLRLLPQVRVQKRALLREWKEGLGITMASHIDVLLLGSAPLCRDATAHHSWNISLTVAKRGWVTGSDGKGTWWFKVGLIGVRGHVRESGDRSTWQRFEHEHWAEHSGIDLGMPLCTCSIAGSFGAAGRGAELTYPTQLCSKERSERRPTTCSRRTSRP